MSTKTTNIWDTMVEITGEDRHEIKKVVLGAPYGLPLNTPFRQRVWEAFTDLLRVSPEIMAGKGWMGDNT